MSQIKKIEQLKEVLKEDLRRTGKQFKEDKGNDEKFLSYIMGQNDAIRGVLALVEELLK